MRKFRLCSASLVCMAVAAGAQTMNTVTRIDTSPAGGNFYVDGSFYSGATSAIWPAFSKHTLSIPGGTQNLGQLGVQAQFNGWTWTGGGNSSANPLVVTADPNITEYTAIFDVKYALTIDCAIGSGTVSGGACGSQTYAAGVIVLTATPSAGYVFDGWLPGPHQSINGTVDIVTLTAPVQVTPLFHAARQVNINTSPAGLRMLVDGGEILTPYTAEWGAGSVHSIWPVSPQQDVVGTWWVCAPKDCAVNPFTVPASSMPISFTSTFVPGVPMGFFTSPAGLSLTIDGRTNWTSYSSFIWGLGETHTFSAPAQQTDAQGRLWSFAGWSNGGAATQSITVPDSALPGGMKFVATYEPTAQLSITSSPAGIPIAVDGVTCTTPCSIQRPVGADVQLSAPAVQNISDTSRLVFQAWADFGSATRTVKATADPVTYTANYYSQFRLSLSVVPAAGASFATNPASADWFFTAGTPVAISSAPALGYQVGSWSGDISGTSAAKAVVMDSPKAAVLNLRAIPAIAPLGVQNAAGTGTANGLAPGSIISIFGANLSQGTMVGSANPLLQSLAEVTVQIDDTILPLLFVSPAQINAQLASNLPLGSHTLTVHSKGMPDTSAQVTLVRNAPGLFQTADSDTPIGFFERSGGQVITTDQPAHPGETVAVYGTGLGPYVQNAPDGFLLDEDSGFSVADPVAVILPDGRQLPILYAGRSSAGVGIDVVRFQLPADLGSGTLLPIKIRVGEQDSNAVSLPVSH